MKVWLDDKCDTDRKADPGWVSVKTSPEVIALLKTHKVEELSLDHDLGDEEIVGSGYKVLEWLEEAVANRGFIPPTEIKVHSANPSVYTKMLQAIESIKQLAEKNLAGRKGTA